MRTISMRRRTASSSSTARTRNPVVSGTRNLRMFLEAYPRELLPAALSPPGVYQTTKPPIERKEPPEDGLQQRVPQKNQYIAPSIEWQQAALVTVREAEAETPGPDQHGEDVHQRPPTERGEQESYSIALVQDRNLQYVLEKEEGDQEEIADDLDHRTVVLEEPESGKREPPDPSELPVEQH